MFYFFNLNFVLRSSTVYPILNITMNIINNVNRTPTTAIRGIQIGEVTHHQDQLIFPVSFRTKNTTNKTPGSPIPFDVFFFILLIF